MKIKIKQIRNVVLCLSLIAVVSLFSYKLGQRNVGNKNGESNQLNSSLMREVRGKLSQMYLDKNKIKDKDMEYGAIAGMVASLDDPYTVFLSPKENKSSNEDLAGEFGGVGISLGYKDKTLAVMSPLPKSPAEKAGVVAGDLILKITDSEKNIDKETTGISLSEAVELIRGKIGTDVTLKMYREGKKEAFDVKLKRDNIVVPSIELEFKKVKGKDIAWVKLYKFTDRLYTEWPETVEKILSEKKSAGKDFGGIVLDLRNNPGGFLQASVLVASDFIKDGVIVKQESSDGKTEIYNVEKSRGKLLDEKLVILVNGGSASASEILAGALKDYNRGKLVGEKTFGKGTVQQPEEFKDGSGLHVTIAKWLLPSGKNIHKVGVDPDVVVKFDPESKDDAQLDRAIEELLNN